MTFQPGLADLRQLFLTRDTLATCTSLESLTHASVQLVSERTNSQTAALFLLSKDGLLERKALVGVDKSKLSIGDESFASKHYAPGASLPGKVVVAAEGSRFGQPQWITDAQQKDMELDSMEMYAEVLGAVSCAAAVPLNGTTRSFGALEIINKLTAEKEANAQLQFTKDDLYWLAFVGIATAAAISLLRQKDRLALQTFISHSIPKALVEGEDPQTTYEHIAHELTGPLTSYKASIIRVGASIVVNDIEMQAAEFTNLSWIRANGLLSYACFPLLLKTRIVGALGLYAGYKDAFELEDISFIESICILLASLAENYRLSGQLRLEEAALEDERNQILGGARAVSYDPINTELSHRHKNFLLESLNSLRSIREDVSGKPARALEQEIRRIEEQVNSLIVSFSAVVTHSRVNLDRIIQSVARYFSREVRSKHIDLSVERGNVPDIQANETELRDVVVNLVSNAIKAIDVAGERNGKIHIRTRVSSDKREMIEIEVEDNGCGVRKEDMEAIFRPAFSRYSGGTSMGLFIAMKIVDSYEGSINVESSVGKGSRFVVRLPLKRLRS